LKNLKLLELTASANPFLFVGTLPDLILQPPFRSRFTSLPVTDHHHASIGERAAADAWPTEEPGEPAAGDPGRPAPLVD